MNNDYNPNTKWWVLLGCTFIVATAAYEIAKMVWG